jgi:hypothetical protein
MSHDDFEVEPIPGLPAVPPAGESILWSGSPYWPAIARRALHIDKIAIYFGVLIAWRIGSGWYDGEAPAAIVASAVYPLIAAALSITILTLIARAIARSTIYTITSRRVVMRFGVALPITFNLPFASISAVGMRTFPQAAGDLPIDLTGGKRLPYLVLWPHVRPWRLKSPQPMLRCVQDAPRVAEVLARAIASHTASDAAVPRRVPEERLGGDWAPRQTTPSTPHLVAAE